MEKKPLEKPFIQVAPTVRSERIAEGTRRSPDANDIYDLLTSLRSLSPLRQEIQDELTEELNIEEIEAGLVRYFDRHNIEKLKNLIQKCQRRDDVRNLAFYRQQLKQLKRDMLNSIEVDDFAELIDIGDLIKKFFIASGLQQVVIDFVFD